MPQASLLGWVRERKRPGKAPSHAYLFMMDIPRIMLPDLSQAGPFRRGDLVSENMLPQEVWQVLLRHGAVVRFNLYPDWPGGGKK